MAERIREEKRREDGSGKVRTRRATGNERGERRERVGRTSQLVDQRLDSILDLLIPRLSAHVDMEVSCSSEVAKKRRGKRKSVSIRRVPVPSSIPLSLSLSSFRERSRKKRERGWRLTISNMSVPSDLPDLPAILVSLDVKTLLGHSLPEDFDESVHLWDGDGETVNEGREDGEEWVQFWMYGDLEQRGKGREEERKEEEEERGRCANSLVFVHRTALGC